MKTVEFVTETHLRLEAFFFWGVSGKGNLLKPSELAILSPGR